MDSAIINQRSKFPGNEPMYIVLLLIAILSFIMLLFCIIFHYVIAIKKTPLIDHHDIENKIM